MSKEKNISNSYIKIHVTYLIIVIALIGTNIMSLKIDNHSDSNKTKNDNNVEKEVIKENNNQSNKLEIDKKENIVIFGDSITEIYPVEEIYGNLPIINSGVSGYKTKDLLERMNTMLYRYNPTKVFLLIGTNDVLYDPSEEAQKQAVDNIKEIVRKIQENRPKAKIYIESIYPVNKSMDEKFNFKSNNEIINNMNDSIKKFCDNKNITYINMHDELMNEDGDFDRKYTYDGLHPSHLGYAKISRVLLPYMYE